MSKKQKKGILRRAQTALPRKNAGSCDVRSAHWYENAKSIDVYIILADGYVATCRIRRALLADYIKRTR